MCVRKADKKRLFFPKQKNGTRARFGQLSDDRQNDFDNFAKILNRYFRCPGFYPRTARAPAAIARRFDSAYSALELVSHNILDFFDGKRNRTRCAGGGDERCVEGFCASRFTDDLAAVDYGQTYVLLFEKFYHIVGAVRLVRQASPLRA